MTKLSAIAVSCLGGLCLLFGNAYAAPAAQTETLAQIHAKAGFQWPKDESRVIICQNNFRHSFSLTWSGKTCDIRRSL